MSESPVHPRPLSGIRVLDLTRVLAGPYCTMILADLGADVVKVEHPLRGDDSRGFGPFLPSGTSAYFASVNRGKRSVSLDLKRPEDRETFRKLARCADVVVENFRPGTLAGLGLSAAELRAESPRLIYASLSGFGHSGTETGRPAYDIVVQALSGLMSITGTGPGHAVRVGTSIGDILTGMYGAIAICAALRHREATGAGATIDVAMLDSTVSALENAVTRYSVTGEVPEPIGSRHPSITPFQAFDAADGALVVAAGNDSLWRRLCDVLDVPALAADPRFDSNGNRTANRVALEKELGPHFARHTVSELLGKLESAGIPSAPIRRIDEVVADPHLAARGMLHALRDADGREFVTPGSPLRMNGAAPPLSPHAPLLGEHTREVLDAWLDLP